MELTSHSSDQTKQIAKDLLSSLGDRHIIALTGELGAGKTTFTQGIAESLGIKHLPSPTFTLMNIYQLTQDQHAHNPFPISYNLLAHVDCYRLDDPPASPDSRASRGGQQLIDIGIEEFLDNVTTLVVIEWAEKIKALVPHNTLRVEFYHGKHMNQRKILVDR